MNINQRVHTLKKQLLHNAFAIVGSITLASTALGADKLVIKGSDTLGAKMVPQIAEAFKAENPGVTFEIAAEGSSTGVKAVISATADIGMSSRDVEEKEIADAKANNVDMQKIIVGKDAIAIIVNVANPITELSVEQIGSIFTGAVQDWSAVGGKPGAISAYTRNTSSGTYKSFQEMAMNKEDYGDNTQKMAGNEQIASEVANNANGIGYVGLAYLNVEGIKVVKVDGVDPSNESVNDGSYALARPLYYLSNGAPTGLAKSFVDYTLGPVGQEIISKVGFVPVK